MCAFTSNGVIGAHWQDEVKPMIMFPSPQCDNTATMILIELLGTGNWIAVMLVGRAALLAMCKKGKLIPRCYALVMDILYPISKVIQTAMSINRGLRVEVAYAKAFRSNMAISIYLVKSSILLLQTPSKDYAQLKTFPPIQSSEYPGCRLELIDDGIRNH